MSRIVHTNGRMVPMRFSSSGGMIMGGAVPVLRETMIKGDGIANQIVGVYSPAPLKKATEPYLAKPKPTVFQGGELLNRIAFDTYIPNKGKKDKDNIKFLF